MIPRQRARAEACPPAAADRILIAALVAGALLASAPVRAPARAQQEEERAPRSGEAHGAGLRPAHEPAPEGAAFDPAAAPDARNVLAPGLAFGGKGELEYELREDPDLDGGEDDMSTLEPELSLAFSYQPRQRLQLFLNLELSRPFALAEAATGEAELRIEDAYLLLEGLAGDRLSLQVGRQRFKDSRRWILDERLTAARATYESGPVELQLALRSGALSLADWVTGRGDDGFRDLLLYGGYQRDEETLEVEVGGHALLRRGEGAGGAPSRIAFLTLQAEAERERAWKAWLQLGHVRGRDGATRVRGLGLDLGGTYVADLALEPSLTLAYAFGTGDRDTADGVDRSFRQSGLHDNEDRFNGVVRFKYYGELFDPELSNLHVLTVAAGLRPIAESSLDLVWHAFRQHEPRPELRDAGVDSAPSGLARELGTELDLVVGYREIRDLDLALTLGRFIPGEAFGQGADANFFSKVEMKVSF